MKIFVNWKGLFDLTAWWIGIFIMVGVFGYSGWKMLRIFSGTAEIGDIPLMIVYLLGGGIVSGFFFWRLIWPLMVDYGIDFLLYPRKRLKEIPPSLSPVRGRIARGDFEEALAELEDLAARHPESGEVHLELFQLWLEHFESAESAYAVAVSYLKSSSSDPERIIIALRACDLLSGSGLRDEAETLLSAELRRPFVYRRAERKTLRVRLNQLKGVNE